MNDAHSALRELGFSDIEALVYCFLLAESPATGYRISKGIAKAAANTYAAIESLGKKGALLIEDGDARMCRAVPPAELCMALRQRCLETLGVAEAALSRIAAAAPDQRIYQLESPEQVFARAEAMIDAAAGHLLIDAFPDPLSRITRAVRRALRRGVVVAIETYEETSPELEGALLMVSAHPEKTRRMWPGQQLNLVVDAREHLLALFDRRGAAILQAVWSNSAYLSCLQHSQMAAMFLGHQANRRGLGEDPLLARIAGLSLSGAQPLGLHEFVERYEGEGSSEG